MYAFHLSIFTIYSMTAVSTRHVSHYNIIFSIFIWTKPTSSFFISSNCYSIYVKSSVVRILNHVFVRDVLSQISIPYIKSKANRRNNIMRRRKKKHNNTYISWSIRILRRKISTKNMIVNSFWRFGRCKRINSNCFIVYICFVSLVRMENAKLPYLLN